MAEAKLILVRGHTRCGAVMAAVDLFHIGGDAAAVAGCQHIAHVVHDIQAAINFVVALHEYATMSPVKREAVVNTTARRNVAQAIARLLAQSVTVDELVREGQIAVVGALYEVTSGEIKFFDSDHAAKVAGIARTDQLPDL